MAAYKSMKELTTRKNIRLKSHDYSQSGYYFITICVKDKHEMLGKIVGDAAFGVPHVELSEIGEVTKRYLENINKAYKNIKINKYVIMPNHIHMILIVNIKMSEENHGTPKAASPTKATVPHTVNSLKGLISKQIGFSIWQRSYHDHIIRSKEGYCKISECIDTNPSKRVIEKCGFQYEVTINHGSKIYNGKIFDNICYSILKSDYYSK